MATVASTRQITPEEFLAMPDSKDFELVCGELVERNMGWNSAAVGLRIGQLVMNYLDTHPIGKASGSDAGYQCYPHDPLKVRKPDVSVILNERLPPDDELEGWSRVPPNLAVEVVSPNDTYSEVEEKVREYRNAGVDLIWVIDPPNRQVRVHRADGTFADFHVGEYLDGEQVLPNFRCAVADLFKP